MKTLTWKFKTLVFFRIIIGDQTSQQIIVGQY